MQAEDDKVRLLEQFQSEDGHQNPAAYRSYVQKLFANTPLLKKHVLEIGSGKGLLSLHCALSGASKVVSIEPELDGSTSGVIETQSHRIRALELNNIDLRLKSYSASDAVSERFDVILLHAVLNHLHETPENAARNPKVFEEFVNIARNLHGQLNEGGKVIATDACRYCIWTQLRRLGYPRKWCPCQRTIDWRIHQQPSVWVKIFREAGFSRCHVSYPSPFRLRKFAGLLDNSIANWFVMGEFILHAYK